MIKGYHRLASKLAMFIPTLRGVSCMTNAGETPVEGFVNPRGFMLIDRYRRNPTFKTISAVGVPKTSYMVDPMASAVVENIRSLLTCKEAERHLTLNGTWLAGFGKDGVAFIAEPEIPPPNVSCVEQGHWVDVAKVAFEKSYLRRLRKEQREAAYKRFITQAIGATKRHPGENRPKTEAD